MSPKKKDNVMCTLFIYSFQLISDETHHDPNQLQSVTMAAVKDADISTHSDQFETSVLIWLDANVNSNKENKQAQGELCSIIRHFKIFENLNQFQEFIRSVRPHNRIVLIVSGQFGREIVPKIHQLEQLSAIYVYCMNKEANEQWAKDFLKVRAVVVNLNDLINEIKSNERPRMKLEEPITINVFTATDNPDQSTIDLNGDFLHSLLLIDALLRLKSTEAEKQEFISFCSKQYEESGMKITDPKKSKSLYSSDTALWWYTNELGLYRMLNEALRIQNIDSLLFFHIFIKDIYEQLKNNQYKDSITLYRGQVMSSDELDKLRNSINKLISVSSFFSSSRNPGTALDFLNRDETFDSDKFHRVLFKITADPSVVTTKPFADISSFSKYPNEAEILFMVASIFRLDHIFQNEAGIWTIEMTLCGDDDYDLKKLYEHMKKEYWDDVKEIDLLSFSEVLCHMGKYSSAAKIYHRLLKELPPKSTSFSKLYYYLGMIAYKKEDYDLSLSWYQKSLDILNGNPASNYINIGELYNCIGEAYRGKRDYNQALEQHNKGIECFEKAHAKNHPTMAIIYNNIGLIYQGQEKYTEALEYYEKSLAINKEYLPDDHADMARSHHSIAIVYDCLNDYTRAMEHHNQSLKIKLKAHPSYHPSIADSYQCIGCLHYDKNEWKKALEYFQKAANIYNRTLSEEHPKVVRIESNIKRVKSKLK